MLSSSGPLMGKLCLSTGSSLKQYQAPAPPSAVHRPAYLASAESLLHVPRIRSCIWNWISRYVHSTSRSIGLLLFPNFQIKTCKVIVQDNTAIKPAWKLGLVISNGALCILLMFCCLYDLLYPQTHSLNRRKACIHFVQWKLILNRYCILKFLLSDKFSHFIFVLFLTHQLSGCKLWNLSRLSFSS